MVQNSHHYMRLHQQEKYIKSYGQTKFIIEQILQDFYRSYKIILLFYYFNPVGSHPSGLLNENPQGIPNNLMPYIHKVATRDLPHLNIFGNDYNTKDGTAERDYIHVMDLANAHILALNTPNLNHTNLLLSIFLIGTGNPSSVLQMVKTFEKVNDIEISSSIKIEGGRPRKGFCR